MKNLIPLSYLNEACFLSLNTDDKKYQMVLKLAQDQLKSYLGNEFYSQIETQYPDTLSADNDTLYEKYIKDYLAWQTYVEYLKFSQYDSTATGLRQHKDESSDILGDVKLYSLEKNVQSTTKKYCDDMINFMVLEQSKDATKYPLFKNYRRPQMAFGISSVTRGNADRIISINKTQIRNE